LGGDDAQALAGTLQLKQSLLLRPVEKLLEEPHVLSGWLSVHRDCYRIDDGRVRWTCNPVELLDDLYHFLNMDFAPGMPAATMIWEHDHELLERARGFYGDLAARLPEADWETLCAWLEQAEAPAGCDIGASQWAAVRAAHRGFQSGAAILGLLPAIAEATDFFALGVNDDLTIHIPERLTDPELQAAMAKVLAPPPVAKSDEILAASGGMFYGRESPGAPLYVQAGDHFEAGDPLYIVEVMKMFNKVYAPFAGTIDEVLVEGDGVIISKGQPLYKITPDEKIVVETPEEIAARRQGATARFLDCI
jgi:biotin carboxyl carrier protein